MSLLVIAYPEFQKKDFDLIQSWRTRYDRDFLDVISPHFTFVFPLENIDFSTLKNHVQKKAESYLKIRLVINRAKAHKNKIDKDSFLFLVPKVGYDDIVRLHDQLYTGILKKELRKDLPYIPHITIGLFDKDTRCGKAAEKINKSNFSINAQLSALSIIEYKNRHFEMLTRINLS